LEHRTGRGEADSLGATGWHVKGIKMSKFKGRENQQIVAVAADRLLLPLAKSIELAMTDGTQQGQKPTTFCENP
jgi:hypothetical protein